jgi:hypothetical protein
MEITDLLSLAKPVLAAVMSGQWAAGACLALVLLVAAARKHGAKRWPALATDAGGTALTLAGSFGGALATALLAGSAPTLALVWTALGIAVAASGGYTMIKRLALPLLGAIVARLPAWASAPAKAVLEVVASLLGAGPAAIKKAETAGKEAVDAKPATGAAGVMGATREID